MGTSIADAIFTATQQRVLALLFGQPERWFQISELIALAGIGSGSVQRELRKLVESGLVTVGVAAGRKQYRANHEAPIYDELRAIVDKTFGVAAALRAALEPRADHIRLALLYGSTAKGSATATSDIDLLLVSDDLTLEDAYALIEPAEQRLGRRVEPTLYTTEELARRQRTRAPFLTKVLEGEHTVLLGAADALLPR